MVYLDYNATTPVLPEALEAFRRAATEAFGNPGSGHAAGRRAREVLEEARRQVADLLGAQPEEIIFVSGGTEANNLALMGVALSRGSGHILVSRIEHPSVLEPALRLLEQGFSVDFLPVDGQGYVDPEEVRRRLKPETILVSVMLANNETGALQPVAEIARICREAGVLFHTDAAQAVGKIPVSVSLGVDLLTLAGHKMYAPKGIGALYVRRGIALSRIMHGAGQERGLRPGTEPVPLCAALGAAAEFALLDLPAEAERQKALREYLWEGLQEIEPQVVRHGDPDRTLPNTLSVAFPGRAASEILSRAEGLCASTGAACHDRRKALSHVLSAMGVPPELAQGTIRFSLGRFTTREDLDRALDLLNEALR
ncbi:cysteine desulfurase [Thermosulfurimonas marina]|uniref:cysteine desulfurase n=1 Tax=Thermosulfurimonas marina TaxID=2047767 RepID=A0A6H1WUF0_9BACT|nr:cysteine desulfurase family protein [Thermosulfurimonas marina]QJA06779.1 cysteine desulfurase [Thermosulfurimonas marina]